MKIVVEDAHLQLLLNRIGEDNLDLVTARAIIGLRDALEYGDALWHCWNCEADTLHNRNDEKCRICGRHNYQ